MSKFLQSETDHIEDQIILVTLPPKEMEVKNGSLVVFQICSDVPLNHDWNGETNNTLGMVYHTLESLRVIHFTQKRRNTFL